MTQDGFVLKGVAFSARSDRLIRALLVAVTLSFVASACGGEDADATSDAAAPTSAAVEAEAASPAEDTSSGVSASSADCEALAADFPGLRSAASTLANVEDAAGFENFEANIFSTADVIAKIDTFRPYQDVETASFGTIRVGLDNLQSDLVAAGEGRFGDMARDYNSAGVAAVFSEVCG